MPLGKYLRDYDEQKTAGVRGHPRGQRRQEWLHKVDLDEMLEVLEIENVHKASADELNFSCPFPGHSNGDLGKPSCYMNDGSKDEGKATVWKCHGCGRYGNAITFYAECENVSKAEAARILRERYAPNFREPLGGTIAAEFEKRLAKREAAAAEPTEVILPTIPWEEYEKRFGVDWEVAYEQYLAPDCPPQVAYLFKRAFTVETLTQWRIGYDPRTDRLTIPVTGLDGALVGIKARTWKSKRDERIKYLILGDKEGKRARYGWRHYEKSHVVFGLDRIIAGKHTWAVLVEGELDVLAFAQIGIPAISTGSAHLSETQARLIRSAFDEIVVFYDDNNAGEQATWGWRDKDGEAHPGVVQILQPFIKVKVVDEAHEDASQMVQDGQASDLIAIIDRAIPSYRLLLE